MDETISTDSYSELPVSEFCVPRTPSKSSGKCHPRRSQVTTTSLVLEHEIVSEPLPCEGQRSMVVDSINQQCA